jgi:hypothetical protein
MFRKPDTQKFKKELSGNMKMIIEVEGIWK